MGSSLVEIVTKYIDSGKARLPVFDANASRVQAMLANQEFDLRELEHLIESDAGLSSALLRVANSSFYGGLEKVETVHDAVMRLGARKVAQLSMMLSQKQSYQMHDPELKAVAGMLWKHSVGVALGCEWLAKRLELFEIEPQALLAGLLHDVGKLFVLLVLDDLKRLQRGRFRPSREFVLEISRSLHCEHGEKLLRTWNLPETYCAVVRQHHDPEISDRDLLLLLVRLVDRACNRLGIGLDPCPDLVLANTLEAQTLRAPDLALAELEVQLEDALRLASG